MFIRNWHMDEITDTTEASVNTGPSPAGIQPAYHKNEEYLTSYVADDVAALLKNSGLCTSRSMSSSSLSSCSGWTSAYGATSSAMSRSCSYPLRVEELPPVIDPQILPELENHTKRLATQLQTTTAIISNSLHYISNLSVACTKAHVQSVNLTCDSLDSCIKSLYSLMAKSEEISGNMHSVYKIKKEINEIKRLLDLLEPIICTQ